MSGISNLSMDYKISRYNTYVYLPPKWDHPPSLQQNEARTRKGYPENLDYCMGDRNGPVIILGIHSAVWTAPR